MSTVILAMLMTVTSILAQDVLGVTIVPNGTSFCDSSCDTLEMTTQITLNGIVIAPLDINYSWTGPNGYTYSSSRPEIPLTTVDQDGSYCVTVTNSLGTLSASDCVDVTVENTIEWTCDPVIMVVGSDCSTDLINHFITIDDVNCNHGTVDWSVQLLVNNSLFYSDSGDADVGDDIYVGDPVTINGQPEIAVEDLPYGKHDLIITLTDQNDPSKVLAQCTSEVRVVESVNNVACNDDINITLNEDCEGTLTPDMILQGDYCYENFTMDIDGYPSGNQILLTAPGDYVVTVTGASGISCWGTIHAEDKSTPILDCQDFEIYCSDLENSDPGDLIRGFGRAVMSDVFVPANTTQPVAMIIEGVSGTVMNIEMRIHVEMPEVDDLHIYLQDPAGNEYVEILDLHDSGFSHYCTESNLNVCLKDNATLSHANFGSMELCRTTLNAFIGEFRPSQSFSNFNGQDAAGAWILDVINNNTSESLTVVNADLRIITNEGSVPSINDIIINTGCSSGDVIGPTDEYVGEDCDNGYWNTIERTWIVTNSASGLSSTCSQHINLQKWGVEDIIWPKSHDNLELPVIHCFDLFNQNTGELNDALVNADTIPTPAVTGSPRVPFGDMCGNFQVTHNDLKFSLCGKYASKTIRTWSVLDWCTGDLVHYDQIIKIEDNEPIEISCQPDFVFDVYTDSYHCSGDWEVVPPLNFSNSCDADIVWKVYYLTDDDDNPDDPPVNGQYIDDNVTYQNGLPHTINDLPAGRRTWIKYEATDECGNTGVCFTEVDVHDDDKPNPVCIEFTVVALSNDGCAKLHAESIDNGSWDNCGIESLDIRKKGQSQWVDYVEYCCSCNLTDQVVQLRVTDTSGNTNTCEVDVEIQDNIPPTITNRPSTSFVYDCSAGNVDLVEIVNVSIPEFAYEDNCDPNNDGSFTILVEATRSDGQPMSEPLEPGTCGSAFVAINYTLRDECNNQIGTHRQNISIRNTSSTFTVNWPIDPQPYNNCNSADALHPDNLPTIHTVDFNDVNTFACNSSIAVTWDDLIFENVEGSCLKILRTWTVIDWCIADVYGLDAGTKTHTQILRVHDIVGPSINVPSVVSVDATSDACSVSVQDTLLIAKVSDQCTDSFSNQEITTRYEINYADGSFSSGNGTDARGSYPYGTSTVTWYAEDHCGNVTERTTLVRVNDVKPPTPYCLGIVVTATMTDNGPVEIWASDFNLGGFDNVTGNTNCGNFEELDVYFLNDFNQQVDFLDFECNDMPNGISQMIPLEVYYEDEAGNVDFCIVNLLLQDNVNDVCDDDPAGSRIVGSVQTEQSEPLENVTVDIMSNLPDFQQTLKTSYSGEFAFDNLYAYGNYYLNAEMNDDPLNGVSTLDLVLIQRHILGITPLNSPFKLIAADADNSGNVSATDLISLRKLILGIYDEFPNGQKSWRFPETKQEFMDVQHPFPYNEQINVPDLPLEGVVGQDFTAVKIGDVNASVELNLNNPTVEQRNADAITLFMDETNLEDGTLVSIPVYSEDISDIVGFQNTINFDPEVLSFKGIASGGIDVTEENLGLFGLEKGFMTLSWNTTDLIDVDSNTPLFNLDFIVNQNANLSDVLYSSSSLTRAEAYNNRLEILDVNLEFRGASYEDFVLYQNIPNPFSQSTEVRFSLPADSDVVFSVYDVNGRELMREKGFYRTGDHTITLSKDQLETTGVMYYTIETIFGVASRKMIQIK
ncbi:MAG: hypothetical protein KJO29_13250 [Bacteroidia bacterium]|nr:hypothetical protein [Bacteroidia bacterium]